MTSSKRGGRKKAKAPNKSKTAPVEAASVEAASVEAASVEAASVEAASVEAASVEPRVKGAWRAWLESLATNAEAAMAAASLYGVLDPEGRDAWLDALAEDVPQIGVPEGAVYGPLLAVETDPARRERIRKLTGMKLGPITAIDRALIGTSGGGVRVAALVIPLYLDFVRLVVCRWVKDVGFDWVRQDPIVRDGDAPTGGSVIDGVQLFASTSESVVNELAHAVLAHRRGGRDMPQLLRDCADLFSAKLA